MNDAPTGGPRDGLYGDLEDLLAGVRRRAEQRALARRTEADAAAERRLEEAAEEAERRAAEIRARGERAAEAACRRCLADAERERRDARLEARDARIRAVFDDAAAALAARGADGLDVATLRRLATDAATSLPPGPVEVVLDAASRARLVAEADVGGWSDGAHRFALADATLDAAHGPIVRQGRARVDGTLEGRLERARVRLRADVDARLHDGADAEAGA